MLCLIKWPVSVQLGSSFVQRPNSAGFSDTQWPGCALHLNHKHFHLCADFFWPFIEIQAYISHNEEMVLGFW